MAMKSAIALAALFLPTAAWAQSSDKTHQKIYDKVVDSIVAIRAMAPLGERSGTGTIIEKDGLILTSYSVCPEGSTNIRVWTSGPRKYEAEIVGCSKKDELTLIRIKPKGDLKAIEFGESGKVKVGEVSYTIGNAANSIINNNQPSFNVGVISGMYKLTEPRANSTYVGLVFETTAAVNVGMEGAPLLNAEGKMVGFVTLTYSPNRFLGGAIPIDSQRYVISLLKENKGKTNPTDEPTGEGALGIKVKDENGKVVITEVEKGSAADRAGLFPGLAIIGIGDTKITKAEQFWERLKGMEAGSIVWLKVDDGGDVSTVKVELGAKK